jgi:hypothetical protein
MKRSIAILGVAISMAGCDAGHPASAPPPPPKPRAEAWVYSDKKDPMTDEVRHAGCVRSNNSVQLQPPYHPTKAMLCARSSKSEPMAVTIYLVDGGQFFCSAYKHCKISWRADETNASDTEALTPSDGSTDQIVFDDLGGPVVMVAIMAQSNVMRVEAEFYQAGRQVMEFSTRDFDPRRIGWDYAPNHKPS